MHDLVVPFIGIKVINLAITTRHLGQGATTLWLWMPMSGQCWRLHAFPWPLIRQHHKSVVPRQWRPLFSENKTPLAGLT